MKRIISGGLLAATCLLALPRSATAAPEEHLLKPGYIVTFEGEVAYDTSRSGSARGGSDTRETGEPVRTVMEFALPSVTDPAEIRRATLSILTSGGSRGGGMLHYALFAFDGDGVLSVGEGLDTDGDGSPDLLEWAAGGDLANPNVGPPMISFLENGEFVFRFERRLGMQDATLVLESSGNLIDWNELGFPDVRQIDINATHETLEARLPVDSPTRFLRLRAESSPSP